MRRNVEKHLQIVARVRSEIVSGKYPPDSRLPTSRELASRFRASSVTVNQALQVLIEDGFIRTSGRHGTFVVPNPPHLFRYGLVCLHGAAERNRFYRSLMAEAARFKRPQLRRLVPYFGLDLKNEYESYAQLLVDVENERLAGLFFTVPPYALKDTPIITRPGLPRIAVMREGADFPGMPRLVNDNLTLVRKALQYLSDCGRSRPAVLSSYSFLTGHRDALLQALSEFGISIPEPWLQSIHLEAPESAVNLVQLLFHRDFPNGPDSLLILDDNLLHAAAQGLLAGGRQPAEVTVVSHANFPVADPPPFPAKLVGYNIRGMVRRAIEVIDGTRRGEPVEIVHRFEPFFDHELSFAD